MKFFIKHLNKINRKRTEDLLGIAIGRSSVAVALAVDGGISTTPNGIHLPLSEIVVDDVDVASPAPGHPLDELGTEVIEGYGDLHP